MKVVSKLLPALIAGALLVSFADSASATKPSPPRAETPAPALDEGQVPPARAPRQLFPETRIQPLVDPYAPNPFGLYQVHGNVFEWTEDCFNKRYSEDTPVDGSPWLEGDCKKRILRGGPWDWSANMVRAGYRENGIIDGGGYSFRVVRTLNVPVQ